MKTYYKISLIDDADTSRARKCLRGVLGFKFWNKEILNKCIVDAINLHFQPYLLTCIVVGEYLEQNGELISQMNFSELHEQFKISIK